MPEYKLICYCSQADEKQRILDISCDMWAVQGFSKNISVHCFLRNKTCEHYDVARFQFEDH
jgi:hypothetical protein